jgi:ATP-dependent NAD(P)H-hydrate dehydratase
MNNSTWELHKRSMLPQCILPLTDSSYKGSSGRVGILGGSALYTGAPHYAATAALQTGADLVTIFTAHEATIPLKCYSPESMVQSVYRAETFDALRQGGSWTVDTVPTLLEQSPAARHAVDAMVETVVSGIGRYHALVVGPGLGRCPLVGYAVGLILQRVHQKCPHMPVILDADALWFVSQSTLWQEMVVQASGSSIILTPNAMEYKRLMLTTTGDVNVDWAADATLVRKGATDAVCVGLPPVEEKVLSCTELGGRKRSGGIGDVLAGTIGTLAAWQGILSQQQQQQHHQQQQTLRQPSLPQQSWLPAAWTACHVVKRATFQAYARKRRSMTAPDVLEQLGRVFDEMIGQEYNE